jgi:hypothetical protein
MDREKSHSRKSSRNSSNRKPQRDIKKNSSASHKGPKSSASSNRSERTFDPSQKNKTRAAHDRNSRSNVTSKKIEREVPKRTRNFIEPEIPADVSPDQLSKRNYYQLKSLAAENAETVARQLVSIERLLVSDQPSDWELADRFGKSAAFRAGRVGVVRRYAGLAALKVGEFERAKRDLRAAFRILGDAAILVDIAEVELGLAQPRKALEILGEVGGATLEFFTRVNARLISSSARLALSQREAALVTLNVGDERELFAAKYDDSPEAKILRSRWLAAKDLTSQV